MVYIRRANEDDLSELLKHAEMFIGSVDLAGKGFLFDTKGTGDGFKDILRLKQTHILLAIEDDRVLGAIGGILYPWAYNKNQRVLQEMFWWVDPNDRGRGIGTMLVGAFEDLGRRMKAKFATMVALDGEHKEMVEGFYLGRGYKPGEYHYIKELIK